MKVSQPTTPLEKETWSYTTQQKCPHHIMDLTPSDPENLNTVQQTYFIRKCKT